MRILEYLIQMKDIYKLIHDFYENEDNIDQNFQNLINALETKKICEKEKDLRLFLEIISKIADEHHRTPTFSQKTERILNYLKKSICNLLTNSQIYRIFKQSQSILLILFQNGILLMNRTISYNILERKNKIHAGHYFFIPELKPFVNVDSYENFNREANIMTKNFSDNYNEKRLAGVNTELLPEIIRNDNIDEFTKCHKEWNMNLMGYICRSVFETNRLIMRTETPSIIEYAAFYGSIKIFRYLIKNKIELTPILWIFAIHSKSWDIIHTLEKNKVPLDDGSLKEAIKCHHNEIAHYLIDTKLNRETVLSNIQNNFYENVYAYAYHYKNFEFIPVSIENKYTFYYFCLYDYFPLIELYLQAKKTDIFLEIFTFIYFYVSPLNLAASKDNNEIVFHFLNFRNVFIGPFEFKDCKKLTAITIPPRITEIGWHAFEGCTKLRRIRIPSTVKQIGWFAFCGCNSIRQFYIPYLTEIERYTFSKCTKITILNIPSSVVSIGDHAFCFCMTLFTVIIPDSVKIIKDSAFEECILLENINIPLSVESIGWNTFKGCTELETIEITNPNCQVGKYCFRGCKKLTSVTIPQSSDPKSLYINPKAEIKRI